MVVARLGAADLKLYCVALAWLVPPPPCREDKPAAKLITTLSTDHSVVIAAAAAAAVVDTATAHRLVRCGQHDRLCARSTRHH